VATFWSGRWNFPRVAWQQPIEKAISGRKISLPARSPGISFASVRIVVHLDLVAKAPPTPHLPDRRLGAVTQVAVSAGLHTTILVIAALVRMGAAPVVDAPRPAPASQKVTHVVLIAPDLPLMGGGGGGGGNRQPGPIARAEGVGTDSVTLRVRKPPPVVPASAPPLTADETPLPSALLDAKPMASGVFEQAGLPAAAIASGTSMGPGSGGGVGTGDGTGIGSGRGPGLGPGSGGSTGGGVYRVGGGVTAPRLVKHVRPGYTGEALRNKIQGSVVLEAIVTRDGCTSQIRVVRSLDRGGLDEEAVAAAAQWRFEPGRLEGVPVDVLVTIVLDFSLR
jgi:TonB family protein